MTARAVRRVRVRANSSKKHIYRSFLQSTSKLRRGRVFCVLTSEIVRESHLVRVQGQKSRGNRTLYRYKVQNPAGIGPCTRTRSKIGRELGLVPVQGPKSAGNGTLHRYKVKNRPGMAPCTGTRSKIAREWNLVRVQGPVPGEFRTLNAVFGRCKSLIPLGFSDRVMQFWRMSRFLRTRPRFCRITPVALNLESATPFLASKSPLRIPERRF